MPSISSESICSLPSWAIYYSTIPWSKKNCKYFILHFHCTAHNSTKCLNCHYITPDRSLSTHFPVNWHNDERVKIDRKSWKSDYLRFIHNRAFILFHMQSKLDKSNYKKYTKTILQHNWAPSLSQGLRGRQVSPLQWLSPGWWKIPPSVTMLPLGRKSMSGTEFLKYCYIN